MLTALLFPLTQATTATHVIFGYWCFVLRDQCYESLCCYPVFVQELLASCVVQCLASALNQSWDEVAVAEQLLNSLLTLAVHR